MPTLDVDPETVVEFHEYRTLTSSPAGMLIRRNAFPAGRKSRKRYVVTWTLADQIEIAALQLFFRSINGGGSFTWTPPGGSSGTYRSVEYSLTIGNNNGSAFSAELVIEEV